MLKLREYQIPVFQDRTTGTSGIHWARQSGKSTVLAAWAVDRLLTRPGRLVTYLSNSQPNGIEFGEKCQALCNDHGAAFEMAEHAIDVDMLATEVRIKVQGRRGRIKILPANARTARGFSGDLILDEFAHHQDDRAIWDAVEPILSSNPDFLCRFAGTGNGRGNLFYEFCSSGKYPISRLSRSEAYYKYGVKIYDKITREEITPEQARAAADDKVSYDQNYELAFIGSGAALLTAEAVLLAEEAECGEVFNGPPSAASLKRLAARKFVGRFFLGIDVGRFRDLTVITVLQVANYAQDELGERRFKVRMVVRLQGMKFKEQTDIIKGMMASIDVLNGCIDMTGIGIGLAEDLCEAYPSQLTGIHFASSVPSEARAPGQQPVMVRVPDAMAVRLLDLFEHGRISIPIDGTLRAALQLPERSGSSSGMIHTPRKAGGHADDFWSVALASWAAKAYEVEFAYSPLVLLPPRRIRGM